jgi:hypothetical protein
MSIIKALHTGLAGMPVSNSALIFVAKITTFAKIENVTGKFKNKTVCESQRSDFPMLQK